MRVATVFRPTELLQKATTYTKRWKGPDGKWRYAYGNSGSKRTSGGSPKDVRTHNDRRSASAYIAAHKGEPVKGPDGNRVMLRKKSLRTGDALTLPTYGGSSESVTIIGSAGSGVVVQSSRGIGKVPISKLKKMARGQDVTFDLDPVEPADPIA